MPIATSPPTPRRILYGVLILLSLPLFVFVDTMAAVARGWEFNTPTTVWVVSVMGGIALLVVLLLFARSVRHGIGRNAPQMIMLVIVTLLMLGIVEWVMRRSEHIEGKPPHPHLHPANCYREYSPSPTIMPGISGKAIFRCNSQGIRGPEFPPRDKATRILCVGGSTTECLYLDQTETWTTLLGRDLAAKIPGKSFWTGSAGMSGANSSQHLAFIQESPLIDQIDVLVLLCGVNDLANELGRGQGALFAGRRTRERNRKAKERAENLQKVQPLWARTAIFRRIDNAVVAASRETDVNAEDPLGKRYEDRRVARQQARKTDTPRDLSESFTRYSQNLREIAEICKSKNIRLVFATQPVLWTLNNPPEQERLFWFGLMSSAVKPEDRLFLSTPAMRQALDQYNELMKLAAKQEGVLCVDLSSLSGYPANFCDDCHFSEAGAKAVSAAVSTALAQHGLNSTLPVK